MNKEILEHIGKATSKDESRYNLTSIYRDLDCFVATDGHRLHWVNDQEKIEKGYYLSGIDTDFPAWKQELPTKQGNTLAIFITKHDLKCLKNMLEFLQGLTEYKSDRMTQSIVAMHCEKLDNGEFLTFETKSANYRIPLNVKDSNTFKGEIGIQLQYLIDAIESPILNSTLKYGDGFRITVISDSDPIVVESITTTWGKSLIMPARL